jgi:glycerol uptake facilitator-like aquaporin
MASYLITTEVVLASLLIHGGSATLANISLKKKKARNPRLLAVMLSWCVTTPSQTLIERFRD